MANALVDLIKTGDKDAVNAYLLNQQIGGDSSGVSLNGQPNNALTGLVRGQMAQPQMQPQQATQPQMQPRIPPMGITRADGSQVDMRQPMNTIRVDSTGQYLSPQGGRSDVPVEFGPSVNQGPRLDRTRTMSYGGDTAIGVKGEPDQYYIPGQGKLITMRQAPNMQNLQAQHLQAQIADTLAQTKQRQAAVSGEGVQKPVFNAEAGGYVYPPTPDNPQGRFVPIQGMPAGAGKPPTEDQAKAAGWFNQAQNAYENLTKSMIDPKTGQLSYKAATPSLGEALLPASMKGAVQSPERQRFAQASSSMSEALLRAATGAGVNKEEAAQKIAELTPNYWDDESTKKQKLDAIPMYLNSLKTRAGRAQVITPQITPLSLPSGRQSGNSVTAPDGSIHNFPSPAAADAFRKAIGM
ncbi:MAG: hypothetical protein PHE88_11705 [Elusimicrobia bacterium]|nr:hypothetical protein [Elusimicrobiota bacterium]